MSVSVQLQPADTAPPAVDYRWDADTDILTARLRSPRGTAGMSGSVELEGSDGSWLILDVAGGNIDGVEVAVWPDVQKRRALAPPVCEDARVVVPSSGAVGAVSSLEVETRLLAESDDAERVIHFRVGVQRDVRTVRVGRDLLLDVDPQSRIAGVWLLNVPPFPDT
ncbi:MAG TPA: hypothetical protein VGP25_10715 [Gemmatimonadaceae bacterium]|nr:hypothetical protein [Gemmatimonadaceae bacterium]